MGILLRTGKDANPNGRPKGSKTKFRFDVAAILHELKYCPFTQLVEIARDLKWNKRERTQAAIELASYVAPKLKSIEITSDEANKISLNLNYGSPTKEDDGSRV